MKRQEHGNWDCKATLSKYKEDINPYAKEGKEADFHRLFKPYEVIEMEGNCLLNSGINGMWDLITGEVAGASYVFDGPSGNNKAQIGIGDSADEEDPTDTDLQAAVNTDYHLMETSYPTSTAQKATFKASFGAGHAEYVWNEWVVRQVTSEICLNRKVEALGEKTTGTWTLEVSITLS